jgi:hypothetical protein
MNKDILLAWKKMYLNVVLSLCFSGNLRFKFKEYLRQLHLSWDWAEILAMSLFVSIIELLHYEYLWCDGLFSKVQTQHL